MVERVEQDGRGPRSCMLAVLRPIAAAGALVWTAAADASAQAASGSTLRGTVRDQSGRPLSGARVSALGSTTSVETNEAGAFRLELVAEGPVRVVARRIGFAPETLAVALQRGRATAVEVLLERFAVRLDTVVVNGRRDLRGPMAGFYARRERGGGRFFTQEQIARRNITRMSDLLRSIPSMRISQRRPGEQQYRIRGSNVAPLVWLDGAPMGAGEVDLDNFDPRSFDGIEIYSGAASVPIEFAGSRVMTTSGGAIVLWTRQGDPGPARRQKGAMTPAERVAALLERGEAFTTATVDGAASVNAEVPVLPVYPDRLFSAGLPGMVEVEFVVEATGRARMDTFGVVWATDPALGEAVRRALPAALFVPATRAGRAVPQLMQLPFAFLPDSGAVARKPKE